MEAKPNLMSTAGTRQHAVDLLLLKAHTNKKASASLVKSYIWTNVHFNPDILIEFG